MTTRRPSRSGRPKREESDVDERLLDAALDLFLKQGFGGTSCEAVARQAGAGKASLYARYPSKDHLFEAVIRRSTGTLPRMKSVDPGLPLEVRMREAGRDMLEHASRPETLSMMRLVIATAGRFPTLAAEARRIGWEAGRLRVRQAIEAGKDRPDAIENLTEAFIDLVFAPHQLRALLGDDPESLLAEATARIDRAISMLRSSGQLK
ncbi:MAG: TetR/AcrR family transcriptional regulator [Pseudomonadota bacterium]|nr:TetR/AcrR family transcriptional regulator [Pseudomonadota bacterium]